MMSEIVKLSSQGEEIYDWKHSTRNAGQEGTTCVHSMEEATA